MAYKKIIIVKSGGSRNKSYKKGSYKRYGRY